MSAASDLALAPAFVERLVAPLFATPERARRAEALLGAPLALACAETVAPADVDCEALRRRAQLAALEAKEARAPLAAFLARLAERDIPFVALKGLASAHALYPRPYYRLLPDVDLLFRGDDLPRLLGVLKEEGFATLVEPGPSRRWGALTRASFAPAAPPGREFLLDVHRLVDDWPAARGLPTETVFAAAGRPEGAPAGLLLPSLEHMALILALHAFRDLYEPRGLKSLFDAHLLYRRGGLDEALMLEAARRGHFARRFLFHRLLLAEVGAAPFPAALARAAALAGLEPLAAELAANYRSLERTAHSDRFKLKLEFSLYDRLYDAVARNASRLLHVLHPASHRLPGLRSESFDADGGPLA